MAPGSVISLLAMELIIIFAIFAVCAIKHGITSSVKSIGPRSCGDRQGKSYATQMIVSNIHGKISIILVANIPHVFDVKNFFYFYVTFLWKNFYLQFLVEYFALQI